MPGAGHVAEVEVDGKIQVKAKARVLSLKPNHQNPHSSMHFCWKKTAQGSFNIYFTQSNLKKIWSREVAGFFVLPHIRTRGYFRLGKG